jgi:hypothetical protein
MICRGFIFRYLPCLWVETVLICRFFAGLAGAASQALVPASVQSLYTPEQMAVPFVTAAIVSPSFPFIVLRVPVHALRDGK